MTQDGGNDFRIMSFNDAEMKKELETLNENLEKKVKERTATLVTEIEKHLKAEEEIRRLNLELKQRVVKLTAHLEDANKELEAFDHSVSHDLRAPLRIIKGFAEIVLDDNAAGINEEGKKLLKAITSHVLRMDELILAMHALSQSGRQKMQTVEIDMDNLVKSVIDYLRETTPGREISFTIGSLPRARGDISLIRQVFSNLLSNAVKFTGKKDSAVVEVRGWSEGNENIYCVKDNGAGFNMEYEGKLFAVFQRLHSRQDFEGTGTGLSIVQKIVHRHGGRLWAEGEVDKGATFCFTLPKEVS
jgi:light-regulated signal transduction histidine kinase (bacteriophytochrome)